MRTSGLALLIVSVAISASADSVSVISAGTPPIREGAVAISPVNPRVVLAAAIGGVAAPTSEVFVFRSMDSGATWSPLGSLPKQLGSVTLVGHWDPVLAFDRAGRAYITVVAGVSMERWRIAVYRSDDNGSTWTGVDVASPSVARNDKPWIAIDDADGIHVAWFALSNPGGTAYANSRDRGATFSAPRLFPSAGWPFVATGLDGDVFVTHPGTFTTWDIVRSSDRGATFGQQRQIASNVMSLPHMVAAARDNVFAFMPNIDGVYFARSTDRGATWSRPVKYAGPGPRGAWLPSVSVDPVTDEVVLTWQEQLTDSTLRMMASSSIDGGATFSTPRAVSPTFRATRPMGEYNQLATYGGLHIIVWSDEAGVFSAARLDPRASSPPPEQRGRRRAIRR